LTVRPHRAMASGLSHQLVALAAFGEDELRLGRVLLHLGPEALDIDLEEVALPPVLAPPDPDQEGGVGEDLVRVTGQGAQKPGRP